MQLPDSSSSGLLAFQRFFPDLEVKHERLTVQSGNAGIGWPVPRAYAQIETRERC